MVQLGPEQRVRIEGDGQVVARPTRKQRGDQAFVVVGVNDVERRLIEQVS